jgi:hypothetical protein
MRPVQLLAVFQVQAGMVEPGLAALGLGEPVGLSGCHQE